MCQERLLWQHNGFHIAHIEKLSDLEAANSSSYGLSLSYGTGIKLPATYRLGHPECPLKIRRLN
jgi:hypothetical protein